MRPSNLDKEQVSLLEKLRFTPEYPDEVDYRFCVYRRNIRHPLLTGVHIITDGKLIEVWCKEDSRGISGQDCLIACRDYSSPELLNILEILGHPVQN